MKFKEGDRVEVVNDGMQYSSYESFFEENRFIKRNWIYNRLIPVNDCNEYTIERIGRHTGGRKIAIILDDLDNQYLIDLKGIKKQKALKSFWNYKNKDTTWGTYCEPQCGCVSIPIKKTGANMTLNVNIKTSDKEEIDYQQLVRDKISDITNLAFNIRDFDLNIKCFSNTNMFIKVGLLSIMLDEITFCKIDEEGLSIVLQYYNITWQDVYNKIKNIDSIEYNLDNV